jgi:predicted PurR-regulated permease PerM
MPFQLSERQQLTVASAITIVATLVILLTIGGIFWLIGIFFAAFSNVFLPLAVAGVMALVVRPYYELLTIRFNLAPLLAVIAVFASVLIPLAAFTWIFGALLVDQIEGFVTSVPDLLERLRTFVNENAPRVIELAERYEIHERLTALAEEQGAALLQGLSTVGGGALSVGRTFLAGIGAIFTWAMVPVYFAFFLLAKPMKQHSVDEMLPFLKPETRRNVVFLLLEFVNILVAFFRGQLIIAFAQGLLYGIGFSIAGLRYGFVLGLALGLLNVIPYLGAIIGIVVTLPLAFLQDGGGLGTVIGVVVVMVVVSAIESYYLTPKVMGDRTGLHPMAIIVSIFFWGTALGGLAGMILAIPLTAFLVVFWRLAREHYIDELV